MFTLTLLPIMLLSQRTDAAALDTAIDMLNAQPPLVKRLVRALLLQRQLLATGLLHRHENYHPRECERQNPRSCKSRLPTGKGYGVASAMGLSWVRPP